jgi:Txe/YoeB family toxin of toxin-antitoxin system
MYDVQFDKQAVKDAILIERAGLKPKAVKLIGIVKADPFQNPPPYEALKGDRKGAYSRRINRQHRFVYAVLPNADNLKDESGTPYEGIVKIIRMWTHYE